MNAMSRRQKLARFSLLPLVALASSGAFAAVPADVTTSIETAITDIGTLGAAIFGVVIAVAIWAWFRRVVK